MPRHTVCPLAAVPEGGNLGFEVAGRPVLICRAPAGLFAVANRCSHAALELQDGRMRGHWLFCPHHGARFDLRTGAAAGGVTPNPIETYPVALEDGQVVIDLPG